MAQKMFENRKCLRFASARRSDGHFQMQLNPTINIFKNTIKYAKKASDITDSQNIFFKIFQR